MTLTNKQIEILKMIAADQNNSIRYYSKKNESTYSYINIIVHSLNNLGLIDINTKIRGSYLSITKKGLKIEQLYTQIDEAISGKSGDKNNENRNRKR